MTGEKTYKCQHLIFHSPCFSYNYCLTLEMIKQITLVRIQCESVSSRVRMLVIKKKKKKYKGTKTIQKLKISS